MFGVFIKHNNAVELDTKYEWVELAEARQWWNAEYGKTPAREPRRFHILSGAIFPIYDKVMGSVGNSQRQDRPGDSRRRPDAGGAQPQSGRRSQCQAATRHR